MLQWYRNSHQNAWKSINVSANMQSHVSINTSFSPFDLLLGLRYTGLDALKTIKQLDRVPVIIISLEAKSTLLALTNPNSALINHHGNWNISVSVDEFILQESPVCEDSASRTFIRFNESIFSLLFTATSRDTSRDWADFESIRSYSSDCRQVYRQQADRKSDWKYCSFSMVSCWHTGWVHVLTWRKSSDGMDRSRGHRRPCIHVSQRRS